MKENTKNIKQGGHTYVKKVLSLALAAVTVIGMGTTAFAKEATSRELPINIDSKTDITIVVPNELVHQMSEVEIKGLIENQNFNDGDVITIHEINNSPSIPAPDVQPLWGYSYETTKSLGPEWKAQDYFVISAAKGQTTVLSSEFSKTITTGTTVGDPFVKADIGGSVTAKYSVSHQFVGPPENSTYNSREFRVQFYAKTASWTQKKINSSGTVVETRTGKADIPTKYLLYSIDRRV